LSCAPTDADLWQERELFPDAFGSIRRIEAWKPKPRSAMAQEPNQLQGSPAMLAIEKETES
jgi:hypothetical protein